MKAFYLLSILTVFALSSFTIQSNEPDEAGTALSARDDRDGSSFEKAIIIKDTTSGAGIKAEYRYLNTYYNGYKMKRQALMHHEGIPYDVLTFKYKGKTHTVYFDISNFFGKW